MHAVGGLNLDHSVDLANIATTILRLKANRTDASFVVLSPVDLHAEVVGKQLTSLSFTKSPPSKMSPKK